MLILLTTITLITITLATLYAAKHYEGSTGVAIDYVEQPLQELLL